MRAALKRVPVSGGARSRRKVKTFPAPVRGWVQNENLALARPGGARQLDNFFPTVSSIRVRGGSEKWATLGSTSTPVQSLFRYKSGATEKFFGTTAGSIFDITSPASATVIPAAAVNGQTAGYYATQQFGTAGGDFLICVNGADVMWRFDGTDWFPCNGAAIRTLAYDAGVTAFVRGETVTGGTSSATATIIAVTGNATSGTLYLGPVTGGPFQDNETLTSATGEADADGADQAGSSVAITGANTDDLSHVWMFANRLWFVEKNTMTAHYLPVDAIGGALGQVELRGVFKRGGSLLFGASWSLDAGDGLDDKCVFVSTEGEVAVYEGSDPSSASTWSKVGVYNMAPPLGINGSMQAGGDLVIATEAGIIPLSEAIKRDVAGLSLAAVSRPIEPSWKVSVAARKSLPWELVKWSEQSMMIVTQPRSADNLDPMAFVANLETGSWCRFTGVDVRCGAVFAGNCYFGANNGVVYQMERGGNDAGVPYVAVYVGQPDHLGEPSAIKTIMQARGVFLAADPFNVRLSASVDYNVNLPVPPSSTDDYSDSAWDVGLWDVATWDGSLAGPSITRWVSIGKTGFVMSPQIQITCGVTPKPDIDLVSFDVTYQTGGTVV